METETMSSRKNRKSDIVQAIAKAIIEEYQPKNLEEMHEALKNIFGPMI